ncbi:MAG: non-canonical purine NTP pyrophosphatase [Acidobacteriota bacterium]|nr:non-canonical purine NTP pyrophosphatase [Acidobacteriota bacterium]
MHSLLLYVATTNAGKLRDFAAAATTFASTHTDVQIRLEPLPGLSAIPAPPEDEPTFAGNAVAKAVAYSRHAAGQLVLADDSGLEVDALEGAPGVRSARYADDRHYATPGIADTDTRNNLCLLDALLETPLADRRARYHCVLAAARHGSVVATASGEVEGMLLTRPQGTLGFGYDPLFYLPDRQCTMAQLDAATKLAFSHRGRALAALLPKILAMELPSS